LGIEERLRVRYKKEIQRRFKIQKKIADYVLWKLSNREVDELWLVVLNGQE